MNFLLVDAANQFSVLDGIKCAPRTLGLRLWVELLQVCELLLLESLHVQADKQVLFSNCSLCRTTSSPYNRCASVCFFKSNEVPHVQQGSFQDLQAT